MRTLAVFAFVLLMCGVSYAGVRAGSENMVCGTDFINVGDSIPGVIAKCGEPAYTEEQTLWFDGGAGRTVRILMYDCGPKSWIKRLTFDGGVLLKIEDADRGVNPNPRCR